MTAETPSNFERLGIVLTPFMVAAAALYLGGWIQGATHDLVLVGAIAIAAHVLSSGKPATGRLRRLMLVVMGLAGAAVILN